MALKWEHGHPRSTTKWNGGLSPDVASMSSAFEKSRIKTMCYRILWNLPRWTILGAIWRTICSLDSLSIAEKNCLKKWPRQKYYYDNIYIYIYIWQHPFWKKCGHIPKTATFAFLPRRPLTTRTGHISGCFISRPEFSFLAVRPQSSIDAIKQHSL